MTLAKDVIAPQSLWKTKKIVLDGKDQLNADSLALGYWNKEPRLASRWDRSDASPKGNPNSTGHPTWYILPRWMEPGVLVSAKLSPTDLADAFAFLAGGKE